ncbi:MAG: 4Fe-4S dicluster domain-containing protein [Methanobacteriaceae archaeon]
MPKHIISGLKYLAAIELKRQGFNQNEIAEALNMNRSTVSHYLNGRNITAGSVEIAEVITNLCPKDFFNLSYALFKDKAGTQTIIKTCSSKGNFKTRVKNSCIGCGKCVEVCLMDSIVLNGLKAQINNDMCYGCFICSNSCPTNSISIKEIVY